MLERFKVPHLANNTDPFHADALKADSNYFLAAPSLVRVESYLSTFTGRKKKWEANLNEESEEKLAKTWSTVVQSIDSRTLREKKKFSARG